jgi:Ca-activated chloride channel family protein
MSRDLARIGSMLVVIAGASIVAVAQQQPTFRAAAQSVSIYATVTDPTGRLVPDLTRDDFTVLDNDQPQNVTVFDNGIQPITVAVMRDMSGSMLPARPLTDAAMKQFVDSLLPDDRACYGVFAGSVAVNRRLTGNHSQLLQAIGSPVPGFRDGTALWDAVSMGMQLLREESGRRVVLAMTDGGDNRSETDVEKLESAFVNAEMMLYVVGLSTKPGVVDAPRDLRRAASVAAQTGGGSFFMRPSDDLPAAFRQISEELHHQYLLGFTPAAFDGKTHKLEVRMKDPNLKARARKSYLAVAK